MLSQAFALALSFSTIAIACEGLSRRSESETAERDYSMPNNWATLDPGETLIVILTYLIITLTHVQAYEHCQPGKQQSPIPLGSSRERGLASTHKPTFNYPEAVHGELSTNGYSLSFTLDHAEDEYTSLPPMTFSEDDGHDETIYLASWHLHTPGEHEVNGQRAKAEMHFVHYDEHGEYRAVVAFLIKPGITTSAFFDQLPRPFVGYNETEEVIPVAVNHDLALAEVSGYEKYWTYKGSLTSPPCKEGLRWFVSRDAISVSDEQMQEILAASSYSARELQEVWAHEVNV